MSLKSIFSHDDRNAKTSKAGAYGYVNGIHYLAPYDSAGVGNICPSASTGCANACLRFSGRGPLVHKQRVERTVRFMRDRGGYLDWLDKGVQYLIRHAERSGKKLALRYDGLSDAGIATMRHQGRPSLAERYPDVPVNEYTKILPRMKRYLKGDFPPNVHYTFSRSEINEEACKEVLSLGGNIAVVFSGDVLSEHYLGRPVINGDLHDLRHLDPRSPDGYVIGLLAKGGPAKRDTSGFVVQQ